MAETFPGQHDDESIDFTFRQHPIVMRRHMLYGLLVFALSMGPFFIWPMKEWTWWTILAGFVAGLIIFGYRLLGWYFSVYIISTERFMQIKQKGFFNRSVQDISHNRIQSVNYEIKGMQATLFKFGTISVQTYAGPVITMTYIHKPEEVQEHLNKVIRSIVPEDSTNMSEGEESERTAEAT